MPVVHGYATLEAVKDTLGITETNHDVDLERGVETASRVIDNYTGRRFWQDTNPTARVFRSLNEEVTYTDDFDPTGAVVKTDTNNDGTFTTTWLASDVQFEPLNENPVFAVRAVGAQYFPRWGGRGQNRARVQVTAKYGWVAPPREVEQATILMAVRYWKRSDAPFGVVGSPDFGAQRIPSVDPDVKELLAEYRPAPNIRTGV